jgi:hypothetical protein
MQLHIHEPAYPVLLSAEMFCHVSNVLQGKVVPQYLGYYEPLSYKAMAVPANVLPGFSMSTKLIVCCGSS